ncbi:hypothetical protein F4806DRAFT_482815 [Annulohypoxylon nitens]|nr:hypothetical protein F4806DRAFT_482815 [Annulohypoxylon nitens]
MSAIDHKEDDQKEEKGIAALAIYCQNLFHRSLITPWLTTMGLRLEETRQKFNAWVSYLGVLATGHASLEHRLRFSTEIRDMVMELLCLLERNLRRST